MLNNGRRNEKLIVLFLFGILTLNYPILTLFNKVSFLFGIPILYFYLFTIWAIFIGLLAFVLERSGQPKHQKTSISDQGEG